MFDTINGLRERGYEVSEFSMSGPNNLPSEYSKYFISELPELKSEMTLARKWKIFKHLFSSNEVETKLDQLITDARPEIAHIHNAYHHLSASTFLTLKKRSIPIVLTLHDVFPLCPNHSLLHGENLAEDLFKDKIYNCARYRCVDNKFLPSVAGTLEAYYYRLRGIWENIDAFICPSEFMKQKMIEYGFPVEKMKVVKNPFKRTPEYPPLGNKIVYLGRLHAEKGIKIFMDAAKALPEYQITIAGSGPEEKWVDGVISSYKLKHIQRLPWVNGEAWKQVMNEAKIVVVPSIFLENCSLAILEALNYGRIVVATKRGGNPEMIIDGETGYLCKPEDSADLARVLRKAMGTPPDKAESMILAARDLIKRNHNPDQYFEKLSDIYCDLGRNGICG